MWSSIVYAFAPVPAFSQQKWFVKGERGRRSKSKNDASNPVRTKLLNCLLFQNLPKVLFLVSWQLIAEVSINSKNIICNQVLGKITETYAPVDALQVFF